MDFFGFPDVRPRFTPIFGSKRCSPRGDDSVHDDANVVMVMVPRKRSTKYYVVATYTHRPPHVKATMLCHKVSRLTFAVFSPYLLPDRDLAQRTLYYA